MTCTECQELKRKYVTLANDARLFANRIRSRHPSPPERRRLIRLRTDAHIAEQLLQNHLATCEEEDK